MKQLSKVKKTLEELLEEALVPEDEQPHEVPENWVWVRLGSVNLKKSSSIEPSKFSNETFELYSVPNFEKGIPEFCKGDEIKSNKQKVYLGDILLCKINPRINRVWKVANHSNYIKIASTEWIVITSKDNIDSSYLMWTLRANYFRELLNSNVSGVGGSLTRARPKDVHAYPIPIPPHQEQRRIVNKIESMFSKIDEAKVLIEEAREGFEKRKSSILAKAFRGELTKKWREEREKERIDSNFKNQLINKNMNSLIKFNIPKSWFYVEFKEIIEDGPKNGLYKPRSDYSEDGILIVRINNFYDGYINDWGTLQKLKLTDEEIKTYSISNHDILINRVNSLNYLGKSALVRNLNKSCVIESNIMKMTIKKQYVEPEYIINYLQSHDGISELRKNAKHAVNQASINQQDVKSVIIPIPPLEEQKEIVRISNKLLEQESQIEELSQLEGQIESLKKTILNKAFRGQLETNDPEEESAIEQLKEVLKEKILD